MAGAREIYVVCGMGRDVTGLVSLVTSIISDVNGNIIDLEESVFHGLFSIFLTVDLTDANISALQFIAKMQAVAHQAGLQIMAEKQQFGPRVKAKCMMRLLLIGPDHPGIVSSATFVLANNGVNIEGAKMISRGSLFAMEMDLDAGTSPCSPALIRKSVAGEMTKIGIRSFFQCEDVYRKKARLVVFSLGRNLAEGPVRADLLAAAPKKPPVREETAAALKGLKVQTVARVTAGLRLSGEGEDLLHALKQMGCAVALLVDGFDLFLDPLHGYACIDRIASGRLVTEGGKLTGRVEKCPADGAGRRALAANLARDLKIPDGETILIGDGPGAEVTIADTGIRVLLDKENILSLLSKKVILPSHLPAILTAFGPLS